MISALAKPHAHAPRPPMKFKCVNYLYYAYIESINYGAGLGDVDLTKRIILHTNNVNSTYIHIYKETVEEEKKNKRRTKEEMKKKTATETEYCKYVL